MFRVNIDVYRGKAYLPAQAVFESGIWVDVEPVLTVTLDVGDLTTAASEILAKGHPILPDLPREEWQQRKDPILAATKARSWKALARNGASYSISQQKDNGEIRLDMSYTDERGRWQFDPGKVRTFPQDTPLAEIVKVILEDVRTRREAL